MSRSPSSRQQGPITDPAGQAWQMLAEARSVALFGHANPDGDVVGSVLALAHVLRSLGKSVQAVLPDSIADKLSFLPGADAVMCNPQSLGWADVCVVLDCTDLGRLEAVYAANGSWFSARPIINIDHHGSNTLFGTVNWVDTQAASVAEQLCTLFDLAQIPLDQVTATCLMAALVSDSQCFRTSSTTPRTLALGARLLQAGAPLAQISYLLFSNKPSTTLRLWGKTLASIRVEGDIVSAEVTQQMIAETGASMEDTDDLVSLVAGTKGTSLAMLFKQQPDGQVRVSLRAKGEINAASIAARFGGGGHAQAAGCTMQGSLADARNHLMRAARAARHNVQPR